MRRRFVRRAHGPLGRPHTGLELLELALGLVEAIAKCSYERVELADELVLKCELDLEVLEALVGRRIHTGKVPDRLLRFLRATSRSPRSRRRGLLEQRQLQARRAS